MAKKPLPMTEDGHQNTAQYHVQQLEAMMAEVYKLPLDDRHQAVVDIINAQLHLRSTEPEVQTVLRATGVLREFEHPHDHHFERWVLCKLVTPDEVWAFLEQLDAEGYQWAPDRKYCTKASVARDWLRGERTDFWTTNVARMRAALAPQRRVHCGCHEVFSFKVRER